MPNFLETFNLLNDHKVSHLFSILYGKNEHIKKAQILRYQAMLLNYSKHFPDIGIELFSAGGRTEIGGNHTDHNHGIVLAASINRDSIAAASKSPGNEIVVYSEGYAEPFRICIEKLDKTKGEKGTVALLKGLLAGFLNFGHNIGGFNAFISSNVANASGLSSSASIEMLICSIINTFYNDGKLDHVQFAKIGQYSENIYWDKPSGLLDQMACAVGGIVSIDFENPEKPIVKKVNFDFATHKHSLVVVNTGSNHADLTEEYASVPSDMYSVAKFFGKSVCRQISYEQLLENIPQLRKQVGDRAILRAMHFFEENKRVAAQIKAIENNRFDHFLQLVKESGNSSWKWLQNCYSIRTPRDQGIPMALAITEHFIDQHKKGVCRVHGGGFAGVILAIFPNEIVDEYIQLAEMVLGQDSACIINIRPYGAIHINSILV